MKGTKEDATSLEGHSGRHLAERWGLPYREAHTLSIDPSALEIIDREESKRLRVLPLELGPDGPVFAVAEPSEERFAAVRELAGDNATFVVVAQESLDALLNSKVFSVSNITRRTPLLRGRTLERAAAARRPSPATSRMRRETSARRHVEQHAEESHGEEHSTRHHGHEQNGSPAPRLRSRRARSTSCSTRSRQVPAASGPGRRAEESLEAAQRELREANEQLAEANRVAEGHNEVVDGLRAEIDGLRTETERLRAEVANSAEMNASMTSRLEEVARALIEPRAAE